jgi:hypothetical protein
MIQPLNYADLFLHANEADIRQGLLKNKDRKFAQIFFSFCYIDDVLSLNNTRFTDYLHHLYPNGLEVEDINDNQKSASYFDVDSDLEIIDWRRLKTKL